MESNMTDWTYAVLSELKKIGDGEFIFSSDDFEKMVPNLANLYPRNAHIIDKIRQQLQILRDNGIVEFIDDNGTYKFLGS